MKLVARLVHAFCWRHDYPCSFSHMKVPSSPILLIKAHVARKSSKYTISFILVPEISFIHMCGPFPPIILVQYLYFSLEGKHPHLYPHSLHTTEVDSVQGLKHTNQNKALLRDIPELSPTQTKSSRDLLIFWLIYTFLSLALHIRLQ